MLNKNIICIESLNNNFEINKTYTVQEVQTEFCVKSERDEFYKIIEIRYPNVILAESLIRGDKVSFKFQPQGSL